MTRALIIVMLGAACGFALTQPAQRKASSPAAAAPQQGGVVRWPIQSLTVDGNRIYKSEQILAVAGLKIGQLAGRPEFEAARDRLVATGAFETVGYKYVAAGGEGKGYAGTFQVTEVEQAYPVHFEGLHVSELELTATLRARDPLFSLEKMAATQPVLERYSKWIAAFMASKGQPERIAGSVMPAQPGDYVIVFHPDRPLPVVALVNFHGNHVVPENVLHDAISGAAIGTPYTEDRFRDILNASIRPVYEARGRVRVAFPEIHTEPATDVKGLRITVTIDEGESYTLGKISVAGQTPVRPETLLKEADLKSGDVANYDKVNRGVDAMRQQVRHAGYLDARITPDRHIDDGKKAVDVVYYVEPGPQYTMGKLTIAGLDLEGEAEIKRIWMLTEGKAFNPEYPDFFLDSIRHQGLFDNLAGAKADVRVDEKRHVADVTLQFKGGATEQKTGEGRRGGRGN